MAEERANEDLLWVHEERALITAQNHNIWGFDPEFLLSSGIVPEDWTCTRMVRTQTSSVDINVGPTRWHMTNANLWISEPQDSPLAERLTAKAVIPEVTQNYLDATPYMASRRLWFAWQISAVHDDPALWIGNNFLNESWLAEFESVTLNPSVDVVKDGISLRVRVADQLMNRDQGPSRRSLVFDCMASRGWNQSVGQMTEETGNWKEWLRIVEEVIGYMLRTGE